ncbi:MAG: hypothetical protein GY738_26805 [Pseudoalteromonas sp.]|nr:hypothetical protein [Pseudoalteromonas sp.]
MLNRNEKKITTSDCPHPTIENGRLVISHSGQAVTEISSDGQRIGAGQKVRVVCDANAHYEGPSEMTCGETTATWDTDFSSVKCRSKWTCCSCLFELCKSIKGPP